MYKRQVIREVYTESWLERAQFGPYLQKNFIDQEFFPVNEEGRYKFMFYLVAVGEDEFNTYAAANGLAAEAFKDTDNLRGILINKNILQEATVVEYEPLKAVSYTHLDVYKRQRSSEI